MSNGPLAAGRRNIKFWVLIAVALALCLPAALGRVLAQDPARDAGKGAPKDDEAREAPKEGPKPAPAEEPEKKIDGKVTVGIYITQVKNFSLASNEFQVEFWIWYRWKGENFDPLSTMEIVNGKVESKSNDGKSVLANGQNYAWAKILATVKQFFDVSRFPLDNHDMVIMVEDQESQKLVRFEADHANSKFEPKEVDVPGWEIAGHTVTIEQHVFNSNLGEITEGTDATSTYSQFRFNLHLKRPGLAYFFKLFWSIFLATLIGFMALLVKPTDLDPRFGLGVGAIFAASASAYVVNSALPPTNVMTLSDKINMLAIAFIFTSMLVSVASLRLVYMNKEDKSRRLDRVAIILLFIFYGLGNFILVMTA